MLFYWKQVVCDPQFTTKWDSTLPSPATTHDKFRTMRQTRIKTLYSINHPVLKNKTVKKETLKALNQIEISDGFWSLAMSLKSSETRVDTEGRVSVRSPWECRVHSKSGWKLESVRRQWAVTHGWMRFNCLSDVRGGGVYVCVSGSSSDPLLLSRSIDVVDWWCDRSFVFLLVWIGVRPFQGLVCHSVVFHRPVSFTAHL